MRVHFVEAGGPRSVHVESRPLSAAFESMMPALQQACHKYEAVLHEEYPGNDAFNKLKAELEERARSLLYTLAVDIEAYGEKLIAASREE